MDYVRKEWITRKLNNLGMENDSPTARGNDGEGKTGK